MSLSFQMSLLGENFVATQYKLQDGVGQVISKR
jgi:hypothetical protein